MVECFEMLFIILLGLSIALSSAQVDFASEVTVIATVGEAFILPCRPTDSGHVVWSRLNETETRGPSGVIELTDGGRVLNGHGKRFALHFADEGDQSLGIFNTTLADAGVYFCTQHNGLKHKVILRVNALVKIVSRENITAIVGERAVIPCPLSYTGPVVWSRVKSSALGNEDEVIAAGGTVTSRFIERVSTTESGYHSLVISNVTLDDARLYRCNTGKDGTKHHHMFLQVVHDNTRTINATVGHSVTLKCFPSLAADVRWTRKNQGVLSIISYQGRISEDYIADFSLHNSGKGFHHLVLHKFRESDAGLYVCEENNGLGEQHKVLLHALIDTSASSSSTAKFKPSQRARLECQLSQPLSVKWKRFIVGIPGHFQDVINTTQPSDNADGRFSLENTTSNLLIDNINESDSGLYVCVRLDDSGPHHFVKLEVRLNVDDDADILSEIATSMPGGTGRLVCRTSGSRPVIWTHHDDSTKSKPPLVDIAAGGRVLNPFRDRFKLESRDNGEQNLLITNSTASDQGVYFCVEDGGAGKIHSRYYKVDTLATELLPTIAAGLPMALSNSTSEIVADDNGHIPVTDRTCTGDPNGIITVLIIAISLLGGLLIIVNIVLVIWLWRRCYSKTLKTDMNRKPDDIEAMGEDETQPFFQAAHEHPQETKNDENADDVERPVAPSEVIEIVLITAVIALYNNFKLETVTADKTITVDENVAARALVATWSVCREWWYIIKHRKQNIRKLRRNIYYPYRHKPRFIQNIMKPSQDVLNFTKLREKTFVARKQGIDEYDAKFKCIRTIEIPKNVSAENLTAHVTGNCLYMADDRNRCVWRTKLSYEIMNTNDRTTVWFKVRKENENVECVAVKGDKELVILIRDEYWGGHYWQGRLAICDTKGDVMTYVELLPELINPCGVTCTNEGTFLITFDGDKSGGLHEINIRNRIIRSCPVNLTHPRKCHYDSKSDHIFVIDVGNDRILLLNRKLRFVRIVMQWHINGEGDVDNHPVRAFYDGKAKQLMVGMLSGRISVYSV